MKQVPVGELVEDRVGLRGVLSLNTQKVHWWSEPCFFFFFFKLALIMALFCRNAPAMS